MGYFQVHFQTTENDLLFSKIMVAKKKENLQMVISKCKNDKP